MYPLVKAFLLFFLGILLDIWTPLQLFPSFIQLLVWCQRLLTKKKKKEKKKGRGVKKKTCTVEETQTRFVSQPRWIVCEVLTRSLHISLPHV